MKTEYLERLTNLTNRSRGQTLYLYDLLDNDFLLLVELEEKLKNNHVFYCPGDRETCDKVLSMENGEWKVF